MIKDIDKIHKVTKLILFVYILGSLFLMKFIPSIYYKLLGIIGVILVIVALITWSDLWKMIKRK